MRLTVGPAVTVEGCGRNGCPVVTPSPSPAVAAVGARHELTVEDRSSICYIDLGIGKLSVNQPLFFIAKKIRISDI